MYLPVMRAVKSNGFKIWRLKRYTVQTEATRAKQITRNL